MLAQRKRTLGVHLAAPIGGINSVAAGTEMPLSDSIYSWNLIGAEYGLRSRLGWREWCTGLDGEVRSLLPFTGSTKDGSTSKLFACTETGIWDVTASSAAPSQVVTFGIQNADSGWGIASAFTDLSGNHWLLYCDEANGYYTYAESGGAWVKVTQGAGGNQINGVDPAKFVAVVPWKNRLWFVERDSQRAWYLGLNALYGTATAFEYGSRFKAGGDLRCLASWTNDGGSGPDDRLVAVSGGGDLVIYEGIDPSSASTFGIVGVWYVGAVPVGRRITSDTGGDLLVMSSTGILPLSKLVIGNPVVDRSQYATLKISNLFNQLQAATATLKGWSMRIHPQDAALMVLVPTAVNQASQQLVMSLTTRGWHQYRDLPIGLCAEPWGGTLYFGTQDGRVCVNDGYVDGVTLADPNTFSAIDWSLLTAFSNLGNTQHKRIQMIRPRWLSDGGGVVLTAEARYSFNFTEPQSVVASASSGGNAWDVGLWDAAAWGGSYTSQSQVFGAWGMGVEAAIALRGKASARMTLVGVDVEYDVGGVL